MWCKEQETAAPDALIALQSSRLQALVARLQDRVPFYRQAFAACDVSPQDVTGTDSLPHLPFTTRGDLRDQYPFGLLAVPRGQVVRLHATSGTRGKPTLVALSAADLQTWAEICARMLTAAGCLPGEVWYVASGYGLFTGGLGAHYGAERVGATVVPASSGNTGRLLQLLHDVPAAGIHCIPSYMLRIAEVARDDGIDPRSLGIRHGSFGGETWTEPLRQRIQDLFDLTACDVYGLSECFGPGVAYECQARDGLHLSADHFLAEIVDPQTGQPLPEGETGELVLTTLTKDAMPLLRYRTGDLTRFLPGLCSCGRTLRRIDRISGRCDDMLVVRGVNLFPAEVERVLLSFAELSTAYQVIVESGPALESLTVAVELAAPLDPDSPTTTALAGRLQQRLRDLLGLGAAIRLLPPGALPRSEGKASRVLDLRTRT